MKLFQISQFTIVDVYVSFLTYFLIYLFIDMLLTQNRTVLSPLVESESRAGIRLFLDQI